MKVEGQKRNQEETNPCLKEQELTYQCFTKYNYDKDKCFWPIENYKACKTFWAPRREIPLTSASLRTRKHQTGISEKNSIVFSGSSSNSADMDSAVFKENDFVWAKMAGYNHWPAIVMRPDPDAPIKTIKEMQWIYFLGTHNYAWIEDKNIKPYEEFKLQYKKKNTEAAMEEMDDIINNMSKDPDYKISFAKYIARKPSPKKQKKSSGLNSSGTPNDRKRSFPLKEKNTPVVKKKHRSSTSNEIEDAIKTNIAASISEATSGNAVGTPGLLTVNTVNLGTSNKFFGFLAGSIYSEGILKNLIKSKHKLYVWSRSSALLEELQEYADRHQTFFKTCTTPRQVVKTADITFSCLTDPDQEKIVLNQLGITDKCDDLLKGKGFVEMTSMDPETSKDFHDLITKKGGTYLEAMLQGNKQEANKGEVIVLAAGLQPLFVDCQSCFKAISKASFLLGKIGSATKIHMIFQMMRGIFLASLVEGFVMADRCSIKLEAFNNIFKMTHMSSDYLEHKSNTIVSKKFTSAQDTEEPIEQLQTDMTLALEMSTRFRQPMPLASNVNEILKNARKLGCDNHDSACIYRTRF
ncbi:hypothetical protein YQE_11286, partial [Dendroctonus ponderosae]